MAHLRIISGTKRGHRIDVPRMASVRPTGERVREAVFSVLGSAEDSPGLVEARVLDLFAGTGALGLEALSRGADYCTFVEGDAGVAAVLNKNIAKLEFQGRSEVLVVDYRRALGLLERRRKTYDLLFVDPPYTMLPDVGRWLQQALPEILSEHGLVVFEKARKLRLDLDLGLEVVLERQYGDTEVVVGKRVKGN